MKTRNKALLLALCALLLVVTTVFATLAYLTATTATVKNTFTVGNIEIILDEAPVDADGQATAGNRVTGNEYKLISGKTYDKDPTVHVQPGSEESYLFVKVENGISAVIEDLDMPGWFKVADQADLYVYGTSEADGGQTLVSATDAVVDIPVFDTFTVKADADNVALEAVAENTISLKAFAIQAEGVTYAEAKTQAVAKLANINA